MASELVIEGVPTNLMLPPGARVSRVEADVFNICERLREHDPNLRINVMQDCGEHAFIVTELGPDGVERIVTRVPELNASLIEECQRMLAIPLKDRLRAIDKENARRKTEFEDAKLEEMWEGAGQQTYNAMFKGGFVHVPKSESYRPLSRAATRAGRKV